MKWERKGNNSNIHKHEYILYLLVYRTKQPWHRQYRDVVVEYMFMTTHKNRNRNRNTEKNRKKTATPSTKWKYSHDARALERESQTRSPIAFVSSMRFYHFDVKELKKNTFFNRSLWFCSGSCHCTHITLAVVIMNSFLLSLFAVLYFVHFSQILVNWKWSRHTSFRACMIRLSFVCFLRWISIHVDCRIQTSVIK